MPRCCSNAMAGFDPRDSTSVDRPVPDYAPRSATARGPAIGVPREFFDKGSTPTASAVREALAVYERLGAKLVEVSLPNLPLSVPTYYVVAPGRVLFEPVALRRRALRPSLREPQAPDRPLQRSRGEGFGAEVKRRIMTGTYVLSPATTTPTTSRRSGAALISEDFARVRAGRRAGWGRRRRRGLRLGAKTDDPITMYLNDIYTIGANLAGCRRCRCPAVSPAGCRSGLQLIGPHFSEARC
jgi:aspartyl-tRNA(Asn)/glutamyl-tRNA(Gln) amidotransferase subunit A